MIYHYIYLNSFLTSDEELDPNKYPMGSNLTDYINGKCVPLSEEQVQYEDEHPLASPEEVWEMHELGYYTHVKTPVDNVTDYFNLNINHILINNEVHYVWSSQLFVFEALCAKAGNRLEFVFHDGDKDFKDTPDNIIQMMYLIYLYYYEAGKVLDQHREYVAQHPEDTEYDYTTGYPQMPSLLLLEVI